ncbi:Creatine kinase [Diplonema papillatum]|nr:Creatine kinase [Diplonema papillatum]
MAPRAASVAGFLVGAAVGVKTASFADETRLRRTDRVSYPRGDAAAEYPDLTGHFSLMAALLTPEVYARTFTRTTARGFTLDSVIQPGVDNPCHPMEETPGCFAGDEECYFAFKDVFDPILFIKHGWSTSDRQVCDLNPANVRCSQLNPQYIVSVRIRASRNLTDHRFAPSIRRGERREIEYCVLHACKRLSTPFQGAYVALGQISDHDLELGISNGFLFPKPSAPLLLTAGYDRDWPSARGAYVNKMKTMKIWVNEQDHLRVISQLKGGDLGMAFNNLCMALLDIEGGLREVGKTYAHDQCLGYLGPSLSNLGTAMKITLQAKLPLLIKHPDFHKFMKAQRLETEEQPIGGIIDVSNKQRLGAPETAIVQHMNDVAAKMVEFEKALEQGQRIKLI